MRKLKNTVCDSNLRRTSSALFWCGAVAEILKMRYNRAKKIGGCEILALCLVGVPNWTIVAPSPSLPG